MMAGPIRERDRWVVCGPCEVRHPASLLQCPTCSQYAQTTNNHGPYNTGAGTEVAPIPVKVIPI